jgi:hypothetical protein
MTEVMRWFREKADEELVMKCPQEGVMKFTRIGAAKNLLFLAFLRIII